MTWTAGVSGADPGGTRRGQAGGPEVRPLRHQDLRRLQRRAQPNPVQEKVPPVGRAAPAKMQASVPGM